MEEKPKSIWKKSWPTPYWLRFWLILFAATFFIVFLVSGLLYKMLDWSDLLIVLVFTSIASVVVATVFLCLWLFVYWVCHWRNFRRFLFGLACFITLIALIYVEEDWRGNHDWNQFKHKWEAQGERFDRASVIPPPVPDAQNFALTPIWIESIKVVLGPQNSAQWFGSNYVQNGRTSFVNRLEMSVYRKSDWNNTNVEAGDWRRAIPANLKSFQTYYRTSEQNERTSKESVETNEFPTSAHPQSPATDVLLALSKYDSAIEALREASRLSYSRFPLNYDSSRPWEILLPHFSMLRNCARVLSLRAIAELENGEVQASMDDVNLMWYLIGSVRTEPFLISQLVRISMVQNTLQPVWRGLAEHKWSEAELVQLDQKLAKLDFLASYKLGMRGELNICDIPVFEYLRQHPGQIFNQDALLGKASSPSLLASTAGRLIPDGWLYQNQLGCARAIVEGFLPLADVNQRTVSPDAVRRADAALTEETKRPGLFNFGERMLLPSLGRAVERFACGQEAVDLARVGIALERYRLAHGEYPETLEPLAPKFIAVIPHDIINGQPLYYHRTGGGQFVLYSVGWNEKDDGGIVGLTKGRPPRVDLDKGDWVWRYPAK